MVNDNSQCSIRQVHSINDINIGSFVIMNYSNNTFHLGKVLMVNESTQQVQVQYYEPAFPSTIFYVSRSKNRNNSNISNVQNVVLVFRHNPIVGKQDEVYLNHEQFNAIQNICQEP
jgi:hypothetical protein